MHGNGRGAAASGGLRRTEGAQASERTEKEDAMLTIETLRAFGADPEEGVSRCMGIDVPCTCSQIIQV